MDNGFHFDTYFSQGQYNAVNTETFEKEMEKTHQLFLIIIFMYLLLKMLLKLFIFSAA